MSKTKKQIEYEIEEATERIVGKVTKTVKGEIFKQSIETGKDVQEIVGEVLTNEINQKKS